jgi:hypothetical protein
VNAATGEVTAVSAGTATITVTTDDGGRTATCEVTVTVAITGVSLNKTALALNVGVKETLVATVSPADASQTVTWTTGNASVAAVNATTGEVTAIAAGAATITAAAGGSSATCEVTVTEDLSGVGGAKSTLGAQSNSSRGSAYSSLFNAVYTSGQVAANSYAIDFIYGNTTDEGAIIFSPASSKVNLFTVTAWQNMDPKRDTRFKKTAMSGAAFDAIASAAEIAAVAKDFPAGDEGQYVNNVQRGDVVAFKTDDGILGIFIVTAITQGASGTVTVAVKPERTAEEKRELLNEIIETVKADIVALIADSASTIKAGRAALKPAITEPYDWTDVVWNHMNMSPNVPKETFSDTLNYIKEASEGYYKNFGQDINPETMGIYLGLGDAYKTIVATLRSKRALVKQLQSQQSSLTALALPIVPHQTQPPLLRAAIASGYLARGRLEAMKG